LMTFAAGGTIGSFQFPFGFVGTFPRPPFVLSESLSAFANNSSIRTSRQWFTALCQWAMSPRRAFSLLEPPLQLVV
jgi:hypothetical protein